MLCVLSCHISLLHRITVTHHKHCVGFSVQKMISTFGTVVSREYILDMEFFIILVLQEDYLQAELKDDLHV
jgi:hypothetical protein